MPCSKLPFGALAADRRGTAALEFAFVGTALMALVFGTVQVGFCLIAQSLLDQAASNIAIEFQRGATKNVADPNSQDFKVISVCPELLGFLDCNAVTVLNYPVSDYLTQANTTTFNAGGSRSTMLLQLQYTAPIPTWPVLYYANSPGPMVITSAAAYVNEY